VARRLLVLALLPIVALATVSIGTVGDACRDAGHARAIEEDVPTLTSLLAALAALKGEQANTDSVLQAVANGVDVAVASEVLGVDLAAQLRATRRPGDTALARLPQPMRDHTRDELARLRALVDRGAIEPAEADTRFETLEGVLDRAARAQLDVLRTEAAGTSGAAGMTGALDVLGWVYDLVRAAGAQSTEISRVWFGTPASRRAATIRLAEETALYRAAGERITEGGIPAVASAWRDVAQDRSVREYQRLMQQAADGLALPLEDGEVLVDPRAGTVDLADLSRAVPGISRRALRIADVVAAASDAARDEAAALARDRGATYRFIVGLLAAAAIVTGAVAVAFARSISRPLRRLAATARAVVDGHLDVAPLPTRGLPETAIVADGMNALVANLRLMEAKTSALATCDFDDPIVDVPLPGRLGQSLQDSVRVLFGSIRDREELHDRLAHAATHDALTGLHNRASAIASIEQALPHARRNGDTLALLYLDIDNFKRANDVHGHHIGDRILCRVGQRLTRAVRTGDDVARLGGDEFLVVATVSSFDEAQALAERLVAEVTAPMSFDGSPVTIGASLGLTLAEPGDDDALRLLGRADLALYQAKADDHLTIGVYDDRLQRRLAEREDVEQALRDALSHGGAGLVLHYQPVVDAHTGELRSLEALVRWQRAGHGLVAPDGFIPIAEESDLIVDLDRWVLEAAARQVAWWDRDGRAPVPVAVNVSGRHLASGRLPAHLSEVLALTGVAPDRLLLEVTETVLLGDLSEAAAELRKVRDLGVGVAVDDFGTGYTSFAHLQHLPVDVIKIDRCFMTDLRRARDASLVRMITELGHHLALTIVAEGVETEQQLDVLRALGVDRIQGFVISRPVPAADIVGLLDPGATRADDAAA
jgi:diguanylate cyclase (GGDEF)-like protein